MVQCKTYFSFKSNWPSELISQLVCLEKKLETYFLS